MNDSLRDALSNARLQPTDIAARLAVDPKTVHRWLNGRTPYPRHRWAVADLLQMDEADLWPEVTPRRRAISEEVQAVYPHRWAVPQATWRDLFQNATREIGILTYSGLFLAEDTGIIRLLVAKARAGIRVRILLGDEDAAEVAARGVDEAIGAALMAARVRNALKLYRPLVGIDRAEIRLHRTVLYNSIYRADDHLLINTHAYGTPAAQAPVIHLRATEPQAAAATYLTSFERVWATATPVSDGL
ncbi:XRE family transcriptional regulator [Nonomuraea cavernae]|uniref:Transcriptional regulator n=1 Tax=Nonomuraea cavernae TaxID=2045107 RepID=A0A918DT36_9ACTN|nr:XRE family transcriptional regulator [Nonomuraea cavernae]MCA2189437.1 XRE family transcriptional regulator [Nonomuraea cavernae]GGO82286.1 transcriptional regulator [Nonomuraea cavernae]